jgi:cell division transport system permease protein
MRALRYSLDEAFLSLWRGRESGLLSTGTIALALFVLGGFLLVTTNLEQISSQWASAAEMSVYLKDDVTPGERAVIERALAPGSVVAGQEYVSKTEAQARFRRVFGDLSAALDGLGDNPLPASYEVRLRSGAEVRAGLEDFGKRLRQTPGVADVRYDRQWLDRVAAAVAIIRGAGLLLASILAVAGALTVANVVRLALYARRDEIGIMQLVGAPQAYIRGPFLMEGVLQGGVGALVALGALAAGYLVLRARYLVPLASVIDQSTVRFLPAQLCLFLVLGGMMVGCLGGLVAAWKAP